MVGRLEGQILLNTRWYRQGSLGVKTDVKFTVENPIVFGRKVEFPVKYRNNKVADRKFDFIIVQFSELKFAELPQD